MAKSSFNKDETLFPGATENKINVISVTDKGRLHLFSLPKAVCLEFSSKNTVLAKWQPYTAFRDGTAGIPTFVVWKLEHVGSLSSGRICRICVHLGEKMKLCPKC